MRITTALKIPFLLLLFIVIQFTFASSSKIYAATSPVLGTDLSSFSVLGGSSVTCTGSSTTTGGVGVSPGTSITGFPSPCTAGGGTHSNDASAIAAQADNLTAFGTLNQTCDFTYGAQDLTLISPLAPGVYCSTSAFTLSGNLTLTGSGVWIFKSVSSLTTSSGSSITGGDACNVWWRVGSLATIGTTTSFIGNIFALSGVHMQTGATLNGRALAQSGGDVTLDANTITGPTCASPTPTITPTPTTPPSSNSSVSSSPTTGGRICPTFNYITPSIIDSRRVSPTSVFLSWGPYSGINTFIVQYGLTNGNFSYSTNVTGFSTTLNALPANQPIWVRVAATDNCSIGQYSDAMLLGGLTIPGFPNTGGPLLPNTGFAPHKDTLPWYIPTGIVLFSFALISLVIKLRKRTIS